MTSEPAGSMSRLGGYRIIRQLGAGAMGAVYEAKQISLDRPVALKTIRDSLASNASSLARFTREAYAAAQMTHHNVVQIYDFGNDGGRHFFSMEWVRGGPLSDIVRAKGSLEPRIAAMYTLQAARGLRVAHAAGMIHRDIKPANLLLSAEGVVKVADMGLIKIRDLPDPDLADDSHASALSAASSRTDMTIEGTAVGTPAYMAPEQATDATSVDHRADIYSLGCTLYNFLTGQSPFPGSKISQVIDGHLRGNIPDIRTIKPTAPPQLQSIIQRCLAKRPNDRYESLAGMIEDLESFLDLRADTKFSPTAETADRWKTIANGYTSRSSGTRLLPLALLLVAVLAVLLVAATPWTGWRFLLLGPTVFLAACAALSKLASIDGESPLAESLRRHFASTSLIGKLTAAAGCVAVLAIMLATGLWWGFVAGIIVGGSIGAALHVGLVAVARRKLQPIVKQAERFIRDQRLTGVDEDSLREFAARAGGKHWQSLFAAVFGYQSAAAMARRMTGDRSFPGNTSPSLMTRLCDWIDSKTLRNRTRRDESKLAKAERNGLLAEGMGAADASRRGHQMAAAMIQVSKLQSQLAVARSAANPGGGTESLAVREAAEAEQRRARIKAMLADARSGRYKTEPDSLAPLKFLLGGQTRLLAGLGLLTIFAIWGNAAGLFESIKQIDVADLGNNISSGEIDFGAIRDAATEAVRTDSGATVSHAWLGSLGIAGVLMMLSAFVSGWRMSPFALIATIVILGGASLGIPGIGGIPAWAVAALIGLVVYIPGVLVGEKRPG